MGLGGRRGPPLGQYDLRGIQGLGDRRVAATDKARWQYDNFLDEVYWGDIG